MTRVNDSPRNGYFERAERLLRAMRIVEAVQFYVLAERTGYNPDACAGGRWICYMLLGSFELAWVQSDAIAARGGPDPHRFWDGQPLDDRRVLIRCLHGLGDTIQFVRYAPLIRQRARTVAVETQPALKLLIQESSLADAVIAWHEKEPPWDQQIEIVELPRIFRTTLETVPGKIPYLDLPSAPAIASYEGTRSLRVGIVWASSSYNPARSVPLAQMARLFDVPSTSFFSLQAGPERVQLTRWSQDIVDAHTDEQCISAAAGKLKTLDLIITVDTMMAHLAGAMGRPVWTLLPFQCDWRWMAAREDSPWYPTMRLFRQPRPADWESVIQRVRRALEAVVERRYLLISSNRPVPAV